MTKSCNQCLGLKKYCEICWEIGCLGMVRRVRKHENCSSGVRSGTAADRSARTCTCYIYRCYARAPTPRAGQSRWRHPSPAFHVHFNRTAEGRGASRQLCRNIPEGSTAHTFYKRRGSAAGLASPGAPLKFRAAKSLNEPGKAGTDPAAGTIVHLIHWAL